MIASLASLELHRFSAAQMHRFLYKKKKQEQSS